MRTIDDILASVTQERSAVVNGHRMWINAQNQVWLDMVTEPANLEEQRVLHSLSDQLTTRIADQIELEMRRLETDFRFVSTAAHFARIVQDLRKAGGQLFDYQLAQRHGTDILIVRCLLDDGSGGCNQLIHTLIYTATHRTFNQGTLAHPTGIFYAIEHDVRAMPTRVIWFSNDRQIADLQIVYHNNTGITTGAVISPTAYYLDSIQSLCTNYYSDITEVTIEGFFEGNRVTGTYTFHYQQ